MSYPSPIIRRESTRLCGWGSCPVALVKLVPAEEVLK